MTKLLEPSSTLMRGSSGPYLRFPSASSENPRNSKIAARGTSLSLRSSSTPFALPRYSAMGGESPWPRPMTGPTTAQNQTSKNSRPDRITSVHPHSAYGVAWAIMLRVPLYVSAERLRPLSLIRSATESFWDPFVRLPLLMAVVEIDRAFD